MNKLISMCIVNNYVQTSILLPNGTWLYRYDLRIWFTLAIIVIESLLLLLLIKPKNKLLFILTTAITNYFSIYFPIIIDNLSSSEAREMLLTEPVFTYEVMICKMLLVAGGGFLTLQNSTDKKKKLFISMVIISVITIVLATTMESLLFGEFKPYMGSR